MNIRNVAIIAHVDHGKTTLVDAMLSQAGLFTSGSPDQERVMDSGDIERERGITITAKNASVQFGETKINIVDTPGHADFGGEVERILRMVDGVILLVDAAEGPMPQTRFVLQKSLELELTPLVVINKVDRPDQRIDEVEDEILDLFCQLAVNDDQLEYPTMYASGRDGVCSLDYESFEQATDLKCLFEKIVEVVPEPRVDADGEFRMLVSNIVHSDFVGRQAIGRIERGTVRKNQRVTCVGAEGNVEGKLIRIDVFDGLGVKTVDEASAGEIVIVAGFEEVDIGDSLCSTTAVEPLDRIEVEKPTVVVNFHTNDSPFAGQEGDYVTSRQLRARLYKQTLYDRALQVEDTDTMESFRVSGRGELHLAILMETLRREGYEFSVSRPQVVLKEDENGNKLEPYEECVVDVPDESVGSIMQLMGERKGQMESMVPKGGRTKIVFVVPTRGLMGLRTLFLSMTKGEGILNHRFREYGAHQGAITSRTRGVLVVLEACKTVPYAIFNLEDRGEFFVGPGVEVYPGMIVGMHSRPGDLVVNVGKTKKLTNVRASGSDDAVLLTPPRKMTLETYLEFINDDELIEVTPQSIRARKRILDHGMRRSDEKKRAAE